MKTFIFLIGKGVTASPSCLGSVCEEVQYPFAESGTSSVGETVLNADLKSTNSVLMQAFFSSSACHDCVNDSEDGFLC